MNRASLRHGITIETVVSSLMDVVLFCSVNWLPVLLCFPVAKPFRRPSAQMCFDKIDKCSSSQPSLRRADLVDEHRCTSTQPVFLDCPGLTQNLAHSA